MNKGNFFTLDACQGSNSDYFQVFRYHVVTVSDLSTDHVEFPISVTFDSNEIRFVYHQNELNDKNNKQTCHNAELFHIKLDSHAADDLKSTVYRIFSENQRCKPFETNQKYSQDKQRMQTIHYSDLEMYPVKVDFAANEISYRDLLLDFLFDLYHSEVFENNSEFDNLKSNIENSHIIKAIAAKAKFYYSSELLSKQSSEGDASDLKALNYYRNVFLQSKFNWCKIIRDAESVEVFNMNDRWFHSTPKEGLEKEMKLVHKTCKKLRRSKHLLVTSDESTDQYYSNLDRQMEASNYKWFLRRYNLLGAASTIFKRPFLHFSIIIFTSFLLIAAISFFQKEKGPMIAVSNLADFVSFTANLISVFVVVSISYFTISNFHNDFGHTGILNLLIPRVLLSMIPTLLFGIFALDIYSVFWNISIGESIALLLLSMMITLIFLNNEARSMAPDVRSRIFYRSFFVILITISFSITINYFAHIRYLGNVHDYSDVAIEYTKEIVSEPASNTLLTVKDRTELVKIISDSTHARKKERLTEKLMSLRDENKLDFALYKLQATNCTMPWKWMINKKENLLFAPGFLIFSCVISILFSVVIQLILDERAVTEPL